MKKLFFTSQTGFSHFTSQTAFLGSWQVVWHLGGSHTGSQIALVRIFLFKKKEIKIPGHLGSSHFHAH